MGLAVMDFYNDLSYASGTVKDPVQYADHLVLPKNDFDLGSILYRGSGGAISTLFSTTLSGTNTVVSNAPLSRLQSILDDIQIVFRLTKEELAQTCKVQSKKTLYNWIHGNSVPHKQNMSRLYDLFLAAESWRAAGFSITKNQLHISILKNQSLFDLLTQSTVSKEKILFAGTRLNFMTPIAESYADPFA